MEEKIAKEFCDSIVQIFEAASKDMGADTMDPNTQHGPVVDREQFERIMGYIEQGKQSATLLTGGGRIGTKGYVRTYYKIPLCQYLRECATGGNHK